MGEDLGAGKEYIGRLNVSVGQTIENLTANGAGDTLLIQRRTDMAKLSGAEIDKNYPIIYQAAFELDESIGDLVRFATEGDIEQVNYSPENVFLGSVSKLAYANEYLRVIEGKGWSLQSIVPVSQRVRSEFYERFDESNGYSEIDSPLYARIKSVFDRAGGEQIDSESTFDLTVEEVMYLTLIPSCESTVGIMKREILGEFNGDETSFNNYFESQYGFTPSNLSNFQHWVDSKPNVGSLKGIAGFLHNRVWGSKLEPLLTSGNFNFGFDLATSDYVTDLRAHGYKVIEKTGYYPNVHWISSLAKDFPPFMTMISVISIEDPDGKKKTLVLYNMIRMPLGKKTYGQQININGFIWQVELPLVGADLYDIPEDDVKKKRFVKRNKALEKRLRQHYFPRFRSFAVSALRKIT